MDFVCKQATTAAKTCFAFPVCNSFLKSTGLGTLTRPFSRKTVSVEGDWINSDKMMKGALCCKG